MRVLITGVGSMWGSRVAAALERESAVEMIVGVDAEPPKIELANTEFVRSDPSLSQVKRIASATKADTLLHLHAITDSSEVGRRAVHEQNVIGTANVMVAAAGGTVRKLVVRSSAHVYGSSFDDPYWFREDTPRKRPAGDVIERSLLEADDLVRELTEDERRVQVTTLRFADVLSTDLASPFGRTLSMPVVPEVLGFDPRLQFVHEHDAVGAILFATFNQIPGTYNVAGAGVLPWSEVCAIVGKRRVPLPPLLTDLAAAPLRRLRVARLPREMLRLLRYGRAIDASRLQQAGYRIRYTTPATVNAFAEALHAGGAVGAGESYEYAHDTEIFLRHSPAVVRD